MSAAMPAHVGEPTLVPPTGKIGGGSEIRKAVATPVFPSPSNDTSGTFLNKPEATPGVLACHGVIGKMPLTPPPLPLQAYSKRRVCMTDSSSVVPPTANTLGSDAG